MSFLPTNYTIPDSQSNYMKFEQGENRFRIMSSPIMGYEWWIEIDGQRKPKRVTMEEQIHPDDLNGEVPKHFWAMVVFDRRDSKIKILEITQKSIQRTLKGLANDDDWGDPKGSKGYDIVVTREGEKFETKYQVTPKPKKPLEDGIEALYKASNVKLEALYKGEDPFADEELDMDEIEKALS